MFFLLSFSNLQKSTRTSFWNQNTQKDFQNPPEMDPRGPQKQYFPGFLEFFISMPLCAIIAVFACPGASSSFQDAATKTTGDVLSAKTVPTLLFCNFFQKMSQNGFPEGVPGKVREPLFRNLFQSCLLRGLPGNPGSLKCSPRVSKRGPRTAKTKPRGCQNAPECPIGRITF